jgi:hypothetical protein
VLSARHSHNRRKQSEPLFNASLVSTFVRRRLPEWLLVSVRPVEIESDKQQTGDASIIMMSQQACHNCRRQRLKCDRSMPQCSKCTKRGQECLGYQRLLLWQDGVASRGKLASQRYGAKQEPASCREPCAAISPSPTESSRQRVEPATVQAQVPLLRPLTDPLTQDLTGATKSFISYCTLHPVLLSAQHD